MSMPERRNIVFGNASTAQIVALLAKIGGLLGAILVYIGSHQSSMQSQDWLYLTFVITVTISLLFDSITRVNFENDTMKQLKRYNSAEDDLQCIGETSDAVTWFCNNSSGVSYVRNTVFHRYADKRLSYTKYKMPEFENRIKQMLDSETFEWQDIATNDQADTIKEFRKGLNQRQLAKHRLTEITCNKPLLQILSIDYTDDSRSSAVLFGWAFRDGQKANVYLSHGPRTVAYFNDYFDRLLDNPTPSVNLPLQLPAPGPEASLSPARAPQRSRWLSWRPSWPRLGSGE
jgi:hypothetical protein